MVHFRPKRGRMQRRSKWIRVLAGGVMVPAGIVLGLMLYVTLADYDPPIDTKLFPGWQVAYDPSAPTTSLYI